MKNSIYNIYNKEIKKIINNENTKAIYLVGSSKNVDLQSDNTSVNDIDLFVFTKNGDKQTRIVKYIENIEFDINYFSEKGVQKFINEKEYFFLKEMKNPKVVYDKFQVFFQCGLYLFYLHFHSSGIDRIVFSA